VAIALGILLLNVIIKIPYLIMELALSITYKCKIDPDKCRWSTSISLF
jgi:hypothetical protein